MGDRNLLCCEPNCGQPVSAYGFSRVGSKSYVCRGHVTVLLDKRLSIFDIQSDAFVLSAADGPEYERRRGLKEQGSGVLETLETKCDHDLEDAERKLQEAEETWIQAVRESVKELKLQLLRRNQEVKAALNQCKANLERLIQDRDFQLSPVDFSLCEAVPDAAVFRLILEDCTSVLASIVSNSGHLLPREGKLLAAITERRGTVEDLSNFAKDLVARGKTEAALEVAGFAATLGNTQLSSILQSPQQSQETPQFFLEQGLALSREAKLRIQGIAVLKRGLDLQLSTDSSAEVGLLLTNALAESYHQAGEWSETEKVCGWLLETWKTSAHSLQLLRACFLLADSRCYREKIEKGTGAIEAWTSTLTTEGTLTQWVRQFVSAIQVRNGENTELGLTIQQEFDENSYIAACATRWQALHHKVQKRMDLAESCYRKACDLYRAHYPEALDYAICRNSLGILFEERNRPELAEQEYKAAIELYSNGYEETIYHASCLCSLGMLYTMQKRPPRDIEDIYQGASRIYSAHFPQALGFATCLGNLGFLYYRELRDISKAEEHLVRACDIHAARNSQSPNYAITLFNLGNLYENNAMKPKAKERYQQALQLYTARKDQDRMKKCQEALTRTQS